jgi:hypothetical protein
MKILKYIFSISLLIWGLIIGWGKLFFVGIHFPFLTTITSIAIIFGMIKYEKNKLIFFISACLWIVLSAETIGSVKFFDSDIYDRILIGIIPLVLGIGLIISTQTEEKWNNTINKKLLITFALIIVGISSHVYNTSTSEINCWYFITETNSYNVRFAQAPNYTFEVILDSEEIKEKVKKDGLQYSGRDGFYCPETKVKVVTSFGNIISAKVMSFRNSQTDKKVVFNKPVKIPLDKVNGKLEILKQSTLNIWN